MRIAPVGSVLHSSATAPFPPASLAAMIPEPTMTASRKAVPKLRRGCVAPMTASARFRRSDRCAFDAAEMHPRPPGPHAGVHAVPVTSRARLQQCARAVEVHAELPRLGPADRACVDMVSRQVAKCLNERQDDQRTLMPETILLKVGIILAAATLLAAGGLCVRPWRRQSAATIKKIEPVSQLQPSVAPSSLSMHRIGRWARTMETASNEQEFRIAVRARKNGRYSYQIFTVAGEPKTLLNSRGHPGYASPAEAAKAGLEAAAVLNCIGRDLV
jgi:hypothetical protein